MAAAAAAERRFFYHSADHHHCHHSFVITWTPSTPATDHFVPPRTPPLRERSSTHAIATTATNTNAARLFLHTVDHRRRHHQSTNTSPPSTPPTAHFTPRQAKCLRGRSSTRTFAAMAAAATAARLSSHHTNRHRRHHQSTTNSTPSTPTTDHCTPHRAACLRGRSSTRAITAMAAVAAATKPFFHHIDHHRHHRPFTFKPAPPAESSRILSVFFTTGPPIATPSPPPYQKMQLHP